MAGLNWSLLVAGTTGLEQGIGLTLNGEYSCHWDVDGWDHQVLVFELPAGALRDGLNELEILIDRPTSVKGDPRTLGLAFQDLYILRPSQLPEDVGRSMPVRNEGGLWRACSPS